MRWSALNPRRFWSAESGLTSLLIFTLIYMFVTCGLTNFSFGDLVADLFFSMIIVAGVITTFRQRWVRFLAISVAVASLFLTWAQNFHPGGTLAVLNLVFRLIFFGLLLAVLIVQVFGAGPVTPHRIRGAIVVYLLLGGVWSLLYGIVAHTIPDAFHLGEGLATSDPATVRRLLTYFSFITLTTTGFGDITPAKPISRTLAIFEAVTGQIYLVVTMARLVSLAIKCPGEKAKDS